MLSGGFLSLSLIDFPGIPASVVFLQGCNWRCQYCHNPSLLPIRLGEDQSAKLLQEISKRKKLIQGVVITGGEPTLQQDILPFIQQLKDMRLKVKLDTNGSNPVFLQQLIGSHTLDYIAMDIKAPWKNYPTLIGTPLNIADLQMSMELISSSSIPHQFRTTFAPHLLTENDLATIRTYVPEGSQHVINVFKEDAINSITGISYRYGYDSEI